MFAPYVPFKHPDDLLPSSQAQRAPSVWNTRPVQLRHKLPRAASLRAGSGRLIAGIAVVTLLLVAYQAVRSIQS